jgi:hypothetical protein
LDEDVSLLERAVNGETELFGQLRAKAYDAVINGVELPAVRSESIAATYRR